MRYILSILNLISLLILEFDTLFKYFNRFHYRNYVN